MTILAHLVCVLSNFVISIACYTQFKNFEKRILIATDIFGRSVDIEQVNIIVNYNTPGDADSYLHHIGYVLFSAIVFHISDHPGSHFLDDCRRAGWFGTKGLTLTFILNATEMKILDKTQARFGAAITNMPAVLNKNLYSTSIPSLLRPHPDRSANAFLTLVVTA
jgi:ATP-dependent RNA helicase UAP56/SUB2